MCSQFTYQYVTLSEWWDVFQLLDLVERCHWNFPGLQLQHWQLQRLDWMWCLSLKVWQVSLKAIQQLYSLKDVWFLEITQLAKYYPMSCTSHEYDFFWWIHDKLPPLALSPLIPAYHAPTPPIWNSEHVLYTGIIIMVTHMLFQLSTVSEHEMSMWPPQ